MAKTIKLKDDEGREYTLEFSRKTIEAMEREGFVVTDISSKPMTTLPKLFEGAFRKNHRNIDKNVIDKLFYKIKDKDAFIEKLSIMYNEPLLTLVDEPEEDEGNIQWEASW